MWADVDLGSFLLFSLRVWTSPRDYVPSTNDKWSDSSNMQILMRRPVLGVSVSVLSLSVSVLGLSISQRSQSISQRSRSIYQSAFLVYQSALKSITSKPDSVSRELIWRSGSPVDGNLQSQVRGVYTSLCAFERSTAVSLSLCLFSSHTCFHMGICKIATKVELSYLIKSEALRHLHDKLRDQP